MLEKLGTHKVKTTAELFTLADKCAKAAEARAWHVPRPKQPAADKAGPSRSDKWEKKKRKKRDAAPVLPAEGAALAGPHAGRLSTLQARARESTLEISHKLVAQIILGANRSWGVSS